MSAATRAEWRRIARSTSIGIRRRVRKEVPRTCSVLCLAHRPCRRRSDSTEKTPELPRTVTRQGTAGVSSMSSTLPQLCPLPCPCSASTCPLVPGSTGAHLQIWQASEIRSS